MQEISLKDAKTGENFTFTGRQLVSKYMTMWRTNRYGRVNLYETQHNRCGMHSEEPCFVLSVEVEPNSHEIEKFRDPWACMRYFLFCYEEENHPLKGEALELARLGAANNGDLNEYHDRVINKFLKKRRLAREQAQIEKEQDALAEKEREAEKREQERLVEEKINEEIEARKEGFMAHPNLERLGIY